MQPLEVDAMLAPDRFPTETALEYHGCALFAKEVTTRKYDSRYQAVHAD